MNDLLHSIAKLRAVAPAPWRSKVRRVAVILSSSRAGSSLIKQLLAEHPDIASLDGEMEPYLALTRNVFGPHADSDAVGTLLQPDVLADNIFAELSVPSATLPPPEQLKIRWQRRLLLQFPLLFIEPAQRQNLSDALDEAMLCLHRDGGRQTDEALQRMILATVFRHQAWRMNFYDGQPPSPLPHSGPGACGYYDEPMKLEEPPFVLPRNYRRQFTADDLNSKILLFKSPSDAYRVGIHEQLFPQAEIQYIHLSRGYAQTVNGLMDGWLSPRGYFAHDMARTGAALQIRAYSDTTPFGQRWWKFDLPPNWRRFTHADLGDVCLNQWLAAHEAILASRVPALRLRFEEFMDQPAAQCQRIVELLGLSGLSLPGQLPVTMATEAPRALRWRKREQALLDMGRRQPVRAMMERLGYSMNPDTWT
ncbi:hypothetical protein Jab_1c03770 [Janthinobacterium sp. HH01]|uniref:sulfotransferase n=1 Tax=Janthinobacterium sp. HH01 TaxID=1198452 RepID=UPI0002AEDA5B|nr:sulfotransferase [Janthinobacterium sp. HH01]ELX11790.1 hypothetical protein Jab_1c03770 [Janthinobacterium sp. HH01]